MKKWLVWAYLPLTELAMERFNKTAPTAKNIMKQKKELAKLDSRLAAKIAER